ncbi:MAG: hypothetical protein OHK006_08030 [Thermodesulfovibrionales bacterium]
MRKTVLILSLMTLAAMLPAEAYAFPKDGQDCAKCHTLNAEQAKKVISGMIPDVKILMVEKGPLKGFWEVGVESGGRKGIVYIDYSQKYAFLGNLFQIKTRQNLTQESFLKISRVDFSSIPLGDAIVMGDKDAKHKVVVFDDPD